MAEDNIDYNSLVEASDNDGGKQIHSMKVYDGKGYYITLRLSDIPFSTITSVEDDSGKEVRGLFIPFSHSGVTVTPKKNVLLVCRAEMSQVPSQKYSHLLSIVADRDDYAEWNRLGFNVGFVGHMRDFEWKNKKH